MLALAFLLQMLIIFGSILICGVIALIQDDIVSDVGEAICNILIGVVIVIALRGSFAWWSYCMDVMKDEPLDTVIEETVDVEDIDDNTDAVEVVTEDSELENTTVDVVAVEPEPVDSVDVYYTHSYNTELYTDGVDYYLLVSVPNGDYPYKLSAKEYLDILNGDYPTSYIVVMDVNSTPNVFSDDSILTLYPTVGRG